MIREFLYLLFIKRIIFLLVSLSSADVNSSKRIIFFGIIRSLIILMRWRSPPESFCPNAPTSDDKPFSNLSIN